MKRFYLLFILLCSTFPIAYGQSDYHPFIEEGKVWVTGRFPSYGDAQFDPISISTFQFEGETVITGRICKRWVKRTLSLDGSSEKGTTTTDFVLPLYEENRRIWFFEQDNEEPKLLYDFNVGTQPVRLFIPYSSLSHEYCHLGINGSIGTLRRYFFRLSETDTEYNGGSDDDADEVNFWVEGIGTLVSPDYNGRMDLVGGTEMLLECRVGQNQILYRNEVWEGTGIQGVTDKRNDTDSDGIYDLSGRHVTKPHRGVYIQNGRKVVK